MVSPFWVTTEPGLKFDCAKVLVRQKLASATQRSRVFTSMRIGCAQNYISTIRFPNRLAIYIISSLSKEKEIRSGNCPYFLASQQFIKVSRLGGDRVFQLHFHLVFVTGPVVLIKYTKRSWQVPFH